MPVHDWTRVEDGIFHDFHCAWTIELRNSMNGGLLPDGYYALVEQHAGRTIPDMLTRHASPAEHELPPLASLPDGGGRAVAIEPPQVRRRQTSGPLAAARRRTLAIRQVSGHRLVALLEIISPANKDREATAQGFARKVVDALDAEHHLRVVGEPADLPGRPGEFGHGLYGENLID
jgi:hypothetical protein